MQKLDPSPFEILQVHPLTQMVKTSINTKSPSHLGQCPKM